MSLRQTTLLATTLALTASPAYSAPTAESTPLNEAFTLISSLKTAVAEFYLVNGYFPASLNALSHSWATSGQYVQSIGIDPAQPGKLVATFRTSGVVSSLAGRSFSLVPTNYATSLSWECAESNIQSTYLADYCNGDPTAQVSELMVLFSAAKTAITEYYMSEGTFPVSNRQAGLSDTISSRYVASIVISPDGSGTLIGTLKLDGVHPDIAGKQLLFTPVNYGYALYWQCGYSTIAPEYLPSVCSE